MRLVWNWRAVLKHAWSIRLLLLAGLLTGLEAVLPLAGGLIAIPAGWLAGLSFFVIGGAFVARLIAQQSVSGGGDAE